MRILILAAIIVCNDGTEAPLKADGDRRVGLAETFDHTDGWQPGRDPDRPDETFAASALKCEDGRLIIHTPLGTLAQISPDYFKRRGIRPHPNPVWLSKRCGEVDVDRFPYLVARMPHSQCFTLLRVNNRETKVLYTTGLHVQDLRETGLRGKQTIVFQILIGSNSRRVVLDDLRLVSELTAEEKRALIPRGFTVRPQGLQSPTGPTRPAKPSACTATITTAACRWITVSSRRTAAGRLPTASGGTWSGRLWRSTSTSRAT